MTRQSFYSKSRIQAQVGFTLVELVVALGLGLIITGAALQLFTSGIINTRLQQAGSELQDSGVFGLDYIARDIRLANYGNINQPAVTDVVPYAGVVLTSGSSTSNLPFSISNAVSTTNSGVSNVNESKSDQLVIQFLAPNDMVNCEGLLVFAGDYIIQRYFLRQDTSGSSTDYALVCDANKPKANRGDVTGWPKLATDIQDFNGAGEVIMPRVDQVQFLLGTKTTTTFAYYTFDQYIAAAKAARTAVPAQSVPRVVSIKMSVLVRSKDDTKNNYIDPEQPLQFSNGTVTPKDTKTKYLRREYNTIVSLRNGLGEKI